MVNQYLKQSNDYEILENVYNGMKLIDRIKYAFIGYNPNKDANEGIVFNDNDIVTGNKTYYTIFSKVSVYDKLNIH